VTKPSWKPLVRQCGPVPKEDCLACVSCEMTPDRLSTRSRNQITISI